jgi:hypothetical protein
VLIDGTGAFLFAIKEAVAGFSVWLDLDQFLGQGAETAFDVQVDELTLSQGEELSRREKALGPKAEVFQMEGRTSPATALAAANAVRSRGIGDLDQAGYQGLPLMLTGLRVQAVPAVLEGAEPRSLLYASQDRRELVLRV